MYTGNNLDKGKLILMLQARLLSLVSRHIIPTLHFIFLENAFGLYFRHFFFLLIKLYPFNNVVLVNKN